MQARGNALPLRLALGWVLVAVVCAQLVGIFVTALASGRDPTQGGIVLSAMVASTGTLLLVALLAPVLAGLPFGAALGVRRAPLAAFVAAALGTPLLGPTADAFMQLADVFFPDLTFGVVPLLNEAVAERSLLLVWPAFALLPGLSEELLFRGVLQRAAPRGVRAILLSAVLFALIHVDPHHVIGVLPIGIFLAWVAERAGVLVSAVAHVANNSAAILVARSDALAVGYGTDEALPWSWVVLSLLAAGVCAGVLARVTRPVEGTPPGPSPAPDSVV